MKSTNNIQGRRHEGSGMHAVNIGNAAQEGGQRDETTKTGAAGAEEPLRARRAVGHTPEPWQIGKTFKLRADIDAPNGDPSIGYKEWTGHVSCHSSDAEPEVGAKVAAANAERIVACVNACAGINPEAIPELLKALEKAITAMQEWCDSVDRDSSWDGWDSDFKDCKWSVIPELRATLAKAKGVQP